MLLCINGDTLVKKASNIRGSGITEREGGTELDIGRGLYSQRGGIHIRYLITRSRHSKVG